MSKRSPFAVLLVVVCVAGSALAAGSYKLTVLEPGFEGRDPNYPGSGSSPWFTNGEAAASSFSVIGPNVTDPHSGDRALRLGWKYDDGSVRQDLAGADAILPGYDYVLGVWAKDSDESGSTTFKVNLSLSDTLGSGYANVVSEAAFQTTPDWTYYEYTRDADDLAPYAGEYAQLRFYKGSGTNDLVYLDDIGLTAVEVPEPVTMATALLSLAVLGPLARRRRRA